MRAALRPRPSATSRPARVAASSAARRKRRGASQLRAASPSSRRSATALRSCRQRVPDRARHRQDHQPATAMRSSNSATASWPASRLRRGRSATGAAETPLRAGAAASPEKEIERRQQRQGGQRAGAAKTSAGLTSQTLQPAPPARGRPDAPAMQASLRARRRCGAGRSPARAAQAGAPPRDGRQAVEIASRRLWARGALSRADLRRRGTLYGLRRKVSSIGSAIITCLALGAARGEPAIASSIADASERKSPISAPCAAP